ncbi:hypothetical protein [Streptomyces murinus]|uniref:hypothetical protein n=1 Tax=Streptomyces murinus TaxID=33900 RepID=UPI0037F463F9
MCGTAPYRHAARVPLDRDAARELSTGGVLFDQEGAGHRDVRRAVADGLRAAGTEERLRPVRQDVLDRRLAPLRAGCDVDLVPLAGELAGATIHAMLGTTGRRPRRRHGAAGVSR